MPEIVAERAQLHHEARSGGDWPTAEIQISQAAAHDHDIILGVDGDILCLSSVIREVRRRRSGQELSPERGARRVSLLDMKIMGAGA